MDCSIGYSIVSLRAPVYETGVQIAMSFTIKKSISQWLTIAISLPCMHFIQHLQGLSAHIENQNAFLTPGPGGTYIEHK